jgi:hypothetical protein
VQGARRIAGVAAGSVVLREGAAQLRTVHAEGYPLEVVNRFRVFALDAPLPLCDAVVIHRPVWLPVLEVAGRVAARLHSLHAPD